MHCDLPHMAISLECSGNLLMRCVSLESVDEGETTLSTA